MNRLTHNLHWLLILCAMLAASVYWSLLATPGYVSHANVVLLSAQMTQSQAGLSAAISGPGQNDLLMVRDAMRSTDLLKQLDAELDLRAHYADTRIDRLSRLASADVPMETFHRYFLKRVSIELDEYAQVLRISAQAYDPDTARQILTLLLEHGESHMNAMSHALAEEQVRFIEAQVAAIHQRLLDASDQLLAYQNAHGLVSPTATVESLSTVVAQLESELAQLQARKGALGLSRSERAPEMVRLDSDIRGLREQIEHERARLAQASGESLNRLSADYDLLSLQVEFARELYSNALSALENTLVETARSLKQIAVLQTPTEPEYPTHPRRLYNITVFILVALLIGIILQLALGIIRDHQD